MKNRMIRILIAVFTVFAITSVAYASNQITMQSDKPLMPDSTCGEAGSIALQFDDKTNMAEGDIIKFALSNGVTVCGNINYYLKLLDDGKTSLDGNTADAPLTSTDQASSLWVTKFDGFDPVTYVADGSALVSDVDGSAYDIGFRVQASDGSRFITLTLGRRQISDAGNDSITTVGANGQYGFSTSHATGDGFIIKYVAGDSDSFMIVKLFNNQLTFTDPEPLTGNPDSYADGTPFAGATVDTAYLDEYLYERLSATTDTTVYDDPALDDDKDNVLCVDTYTGSYSGDYVYAVPTSEPYGGVSTYQQTFFGDYIVAQLVEEMTYTVEEACKDDICNYISTTSGVDQDGDDIPATGAFDFGVYDSTSTTASSVDRWGSDGYCVGDTIGNGLKFSLPGDTFTEGDEFRFTFVIRVGSSADSDIVTWDNNQVDGVYWANSNDDEICDTSNSGLSDSPTVSWSSYTTGYDAGTAFRGKITVGSADATNNALIFDLESADINLSNASAGQKVYVDVIVEKLPCGTIVSETICLAELIEDCPSTSGAAAIDGIAFIGDRMLSDVLHGYLGRTNQSTDGATSTLTFPYAPSLDDSNFFTGICISNTGTASGKLVFTLTDANGGSATYTKTGVGAGTQFVTTLDAMEDDLVDGATPLDTEETVYVSVAVTTE